MNYCTLFNSFYLSRGLALYDSLRKTAKSFHLYIFAFDEAVYNILTALQLPQVTVISLAEFESPALLAVKPQRTLAEYCWTCSSASILYCLEKYQLTEICYLDADLYFWNDPAILLKEVGHDSILLTEHRYTPKYDQSLTSGKYCVQFMFFKNNPEGLSALKWWQEACLDWCYNRFEEGKFGDQKYLDDWLSRFAGVRVLAHLGGGVAPWNVQQYRFITADNQLMLQPRDNHKPAQKLVELVFYHFHALKFINDTIHLGGYQLSSAVKNLLYRPYINALLAIETRLKADSRVADMIININLHGQTAQRYSVIDKIRQLKQRIFVSDNVLHLAALKG